MLWNHMMIRHGWLCVHDKTTTDWLLDDPFYYPHGGYWPRYRPVRHSYRLVRARAIKYLE